MLWVTTVLWPWVKKWWKWLLLFPAGLLLFLLGKSKGKVTVVSTRPETEAAQKTQEKAAQEALIEEEKARQQKAQATQDVLKEHAQDSEAVLDEQRSAADPLPTPTEVTEYLRKVGKQARS